MFLKHLILRQLSSFPSSSSSKATISRLLKVGDILRRRSRFSEEDVIEYSRLTHDLNPIHLHSESSQAAGFEARPVVHGLLVAALFPRIIASHFQKDLNEQSFLVVYPARYDVAASLAKLNKSYTPLVEVPGAVYVSQSLKFKLPVYIEDEVIAEVQATDLRENRKRYIAKFLTKCFKNGELLVVDGEAVAILPTLAMSEEQHF